MRACTTLPPTSGLVIGSCASAAGRCEPEDDWLHVFELEDDRNKNDMPGNPLRHTETQRHTCLRLPHTVTYSDPCITPLTPMYCCVYHNLCDDLHTAPDNQYRSTASTHKTHKTHNARTPSSMRVPFLGRACPIIFTQQTRKPSSQKLTKTTTPTTLGTSFSLRWTARSSRRRYAPARAPLV
jgi:hypothetical protein